MSNKSKTSKIEASTKILMTCGLAWIFAGGLIATVVGLQQVGMGQALYGLGSLLIGALALGSGWFMRNELSQAPAAQAR